ncbi:MAG TPA: glycosyltransferase [Gemmataceae bacterium]|nr:glycosyltransferase [Gemmataceae bacterium]
MKVVACHHYLARRGAEDLAFERDVALLERHGHVVIRLTLDNRDVRRRGRLGMVRDAVWNRKFCRRLSDLARTERPAVVHFHNIFPLISPAAYYAARSQGAAVVQTLHRFDPFRPTGTLPKIHHAHFRRREAVAMVEAAALGFHGAIGTYRRAVDCYFAASDAARDSFTKAGLLPAGRIVVRPGPEMDFALNTSAGPAYERLMAGYEQAIRRRAGIAGRAPAIRHRDQVDPATLRRRAIAARWRPEFAAGETWVPTTSSLAIVRADAPIAFQAKVA